MSSLVLALSGVDEIVVAADGLGFVGDENGHYEFEFGKKFRVVTNKNWVLGFAGTELGQPLFEIIDRKDRLPAKDINETAMYLFKGMRDLYEQFALQREKTELLLAGIQDGKPHIYTWEFSSSLSRGSESRGPELSVPYYAIGAKRHGALYFANKLLRRKLNTSQLVQLAHFCVSETASHDPSVGGKIEIVIVREDSVESVAPPDMQRLAARSEGISNSVDELFLSFEPPQESA
jgi:Proteasome subunit